MDNENLLLSAAFAFLFVIVIGLARESSAYSACTYANKVETCSKRWVPDE